jgi:hypothetical protein
VDDDLRTVVRPLRAMQFFFGYLFDNQATFHFHMNDAV